jgi:hypothetical protein
MESRTKRDRDKHEKTEEGESGRTQTLPSNMAPAPWLVASQTIDCFHRRGVRKRKEATAEPIIKVLVHGRPPAGAAIWCELDSIGYSESHAAH